MPDVKRALNDRKRNEYFIAVAKTIAFGSKCPDGKQHGAIAVKNQRMISTGYNGPASGQPHCGTDCPLDVHKRVHGKKDFSICPAVHAEVNCIVTAATCGTALEGAVIYVTKEPCQACLAMLRNASLSGVVYPDDSDNGDHYFMMGPALLLSVRINYPEDLNVPRKSHRRSS